MNADALTNRRALLALYVPMFGVLFLVVIAARYGHIPVSNMTRDIAAIANVHPLTGVVSNLGVLLWCATAAICLFSSSLLRQQGARPQASFLLWAGLLTTGLLVDDFFMLHEFLAPVHFHLNEKVVLASYGCVTALYLLRHRRLILESSYWMLAAALVLFAVSVMFDLADGHGWSRLGEDGCKLLGIATWLGYHAGRARYWLMQMPVTRSTASNAVGLDVAPAAPIHN